MATNKLSAKFYETATAGTHFDSEVLYLLVRVDGRRYWHMACYLHGKRKLLSFGASPQRFQSNFRLLYYLACLCISGSLFAPENYISFRRPIMESHYIKGD